MNKENPNSGKSSRSVSNGNQDRTRLGSSITAQNAAVSRVQDKSDATRVGSAVRPQKPKTAPAKPGPQQGKKKNPKEASAENWKALRSTAVRALLYIAFVAVISTVLSVFGIRWANDVFALVKDEITCEVEIPENATISEVASILKQKGIIEYPFIFRMYVGYKHRNDDPALSFRAGSYEIKSTMNFDQIVNAIKYRRSRTIVKLMIPEGYSINEMIDLFLEQGIGTREGFVEAINHYDYEYRFMDALNQLELSEDRVYRLEGYLFPDTYEFYTDSSEVDIVDKMLANFDSKFEEGYYARCEELHYNIDQVITLASIVQGEGKINSEFYTIAGVFYNRLASRDYPKLESDATIQYCLNTHKEDLTQSDLNIDNPYNTHLYNGLPPGAICNPGWEAIQAALYPESHSYYYILADTDGSTLFAKTLPEHLNNIAAVARAKENGTSVD